MELPKRKKMRLTEYDYSLNGAYFITVCIKDKHEMLWKNVGENIVRLQASNDLSEYGTATDNAINRIIEHYPCVLVDKYVVMPNHIHMILLLSNYDGRTVFAPTISRVIKHMKESITKQIGFPIWQKSFHDRIIRNEREYIKIWQYIDTNPMKWEEDCFYTP